MTQAPLRDLHILDMSRLLPGPLCTLMLADMGADVIKLEEPASGDYLRFMPPQVEGLNPLFCLLNRNKRSLALNLKSEEGRDIFYRLIQSFDVVVESFRPGVMERLGIGYQSLKKLNPNIILCSISGYGSKDKFSNWAGHDLNYVGLAGLGSVPAGRSSQQVPANPMLQLADNATALFASLSILAALRARENFTPTAEAGEGEIGGRHIEISMAETVFSFAFPHLAHYNYFQEKYRVDKEPLSGKYPCYRFYRTAPPEDGGETGNLVSFAPLEPKFWQNFIQATGRKDLITRQYDLSQETHQQMEELFAEKSLETWLQLNQKYDFCLQKALQDHEIFSSDYWFQRGTMADLNIAKSPNQPNPTTFKVLRPPLPHHQELIPPPGLGEHSAEILMENGGISSEQLKILAKKKIVKLG